MSTAANLDWQATACMLCFSNCGLKVQTQDGHILHVRGDKENPMSHGYVCNKAQQIDYYQNTADRLETPLRRKADGSFEPVGWDIAMEEIAARLLHIRETFGGKSFIFCAGGQANHIGSGYLGSILTAMGSPWMTNSLAQEKTGEYWVDGRLFGHQGANTTHDIENTDVAVFIGKNPWQSHGFPAARQHLNKIIHDPDRKLIVIDPVLTDTAKRADIHLRVKPGCDAYLLAAICATLVTEQGLLDQEFLGERTIGNEDVIDALSKVPIADFCERAGVPMEQMAEVARVIGEAKSAAIVEDLGIQQSLHSTLNSYLGKLMYLLTGNMGNAGGVNLNFGAGHEPGAHTQEGEAALVTPVIGHKMIKNIFPCNVLADEILTDHPDRLRAMLVNSANPVVTYPDSQRMAEAMDALDFLVVIDVAMTETARHADYVLPAATQFEKWECSLLYLRYTFPENTFHLRAPVLPPRPGTLPEPEIAQRLIRAMGELTDEFTELHAAIAKSRENFAGEFARAMTNNEQASRYPAIVLYETLGPTLPDGSAAASLLWPMAHGLAAKEAEAVSRAGHAGEGLALGEALFEAMITARSGIKLTTHEYDDNWRRLRHDDGRIHLAIDELLEMLNELRDESLPEDPDFPFILAAGERRSSNANSIMRDPAWRKGDTVGRLRIHPDDAAKLHLSKGDSAKITSVRASIETEVEITDVVPVGYVTLPHGFGMIYPDENGIEKKHGPQINELTDANHRCPIAGTPYHKYVPVQIEAV